ncbi:MAG: hypothetical protein LM560_04865 [Desulfurococcaceae archaeon]|nr:hypothetical protein [Desulfurococcaceae archaeon]
MSQQQKQTKELRIVTRPVITIDSIRNDESKIKLLYIIKHLKSISEKALINLVYLLQTESKVKFKYSFTTIGGIPFSKQLRDDINILLYLGLIETDAVTRKLKLTSNGLEFLEKNPLNQEELNNLISSVDGLKSKVNAIEAEIDLTTRKVRGMRR